MKYWNYVILAIGLGLFFDLAGFDIGSSILTFFNISQDGIGITGSTLWLSILGLSVASAIGIGILTKSSPENYIVWPLILLSATAVMTPFLGIAIASASYPNWIYYPVLFIMSVLTVGFAVSVYEHFRGSD